MSEAPKPRKSNVHHAPAAGNQERDQVIPDMQVVREAVHEHEGRARTRIIPSVDFSFAPRNAMLDEGGVIGRHALPFFLTEALMGVA
ncbi:hypothetical protein ACVWWR_003498 [Bradyrhizobium sp. LM3.2]